jgi:excisionase family DNA binding protein
LGPTTPAQPPKPNTQGERSPTIAGIAPLWTIKDVSEFLGIPVQTLYTWRHQGTGPKAYRCGRHLRYDPDEIRRWLAEETTGQASIQKPDSKLPHLR